MNPSRTERNSDRHAPISVSKVWVDRSPLIEVELGPVDLPN